jgi:HK97 family phage portal protein
VLPQYQREPTSHELLAELKNTAFACASINAAVCAAHPPRLYVATHESQPRPRVATRGLDRMVEKRLRALPHLAPRLAKAACIEEVTEHPLLTLLRQVNPVHNAFDLWELTTMYQEVHGCAYWLLRFDPFGVPREIWVLPSQHMSAVRSSLSLVSSPLPFATDNGQRTTDVAYEYRHGGQMHRYAADEIVHFRYPDPRQPYSAGLSPLKACWEHATLSSDYTAFRQARFANRAIPDAIVSPDETIGDEERDRLEQEWNAKFRRGGNGRVVVAESGLKVQLLNQSLGDLAALAEQGATKEAICNAFHVPIAFLTSQTNLANLQASQTQHMTLGIRPRLVRRDEKLNEQLIPLYDPTGRLFLASDDPVPADADQGRQQMEQDLKYGVITVNEARAAKGLPPVTWGDVPWLPLLWERTDFPRRGDEAPRSGRNREANNE